MHFELGISSWVAQGTHVSREGPATQTGNRLGNPHELGKRGEMKLAVVNGVASLYQLVGSDTLTDKNREQEEISCALSFETTWNVEPKPEVERGAGDNGRWEKDSGAHARRNRERLTTRAKMPRQPVTLETNRDRGEGKKK